MQRVTPLVSTVVATYNMADYLPLAVRSILAQTYENIEVLIVDDGSTDDTSKAIEPFLKDSRVKLIRQQNSGQATAKNRGVREARGEFVAFLDADDIWAPEKLALQLPLFAKSESVGVVFSDFVYIDERGVRQWPSNSVLHRGQVSGKLLIFNFVAFGTSVVRKACFEKLGGFREEMRMGIDYDLWLRFSTQYSFDYVAQPLLYYRVWSGQMSRNWKDRYQAGIEIMKDFLKRFPHVVDKDTQNEAWASTYVGLGRSVREEDRRFAAPMPYYLRALRHRPGYLPAWKAIAAALLRV